MLDSAVRLREEADKARRAIFGGEKMARQRHQRGTLYVRGKRRKVYVLRYSESVALLGGKTGTIRRSVVLGAVSEVGSKSQARKLVDDYLQRLNLTFRRPRSAMTVREFAENQWKPTILPTLKYATQRNYDYLLCTHVSACPR